MKRIFLYFLAVTAVLAVSCSREATPVPEAELVFGNVAVSIGGEPLAGDSDTRSVVTLNVESFKDAYLFAFDASTKKVLTYPEHAGDLAGTGPVAVKVTSKTFNWALPVNKEMDIWVVVNAGSYSSLMDSYLADAELAESDLYGEELMFTCQNANELKALETNGYGLPMSGRMDGVKLTSFNEGLSVTVKRLFAKYEIYFDTKGFTDEGYSVKSTYLMSSKSNTEVPFFYDEGYAQTDASKLATVDRSTETDLVTLDAGGKVTLYYLENCQGDKSGAKNWYSVYDDLGSNAVKLCSYMEVGVNVTRASDGTDKSFAYRIYLGKTDMKSNFDVERNYFRTIKLTLKPGGTNHIVDGFMFTNENTLSVSPGGSVTIPFETSLEQGEIDYVISQTGMSVSNKNWSSTNSAKKTRLPYSGTVTLTAASNASYGTYDVTGGSESRSLTDVAHVNVENPYVFQAIDITCEVTSGSLTITGRGNDMNVGVHINDGNNCTVVLNARVKYNNQWYDVVPQTGNPDPKVSFWMTGFSGGSANPNYASTALWGQEMTEWYMPGDVDVVVIFFNNEEVARFNINYGSSYSGGEGYVPTFQGLEFVHSITAKGVTYTGTGDDFSVIVDQGRTDISWQVTGRVKYDDVWHDIASESYIGLKNGSIAMDLSGSSYVYLAEGVDGIPSTFTLYWGTTPMKTWNVSYVTDPDEVVLDVNCVVSGGGATSTGHGEDMSYYVGNNGADVTVDVSGRIKYGGTWHNIPGDSNVTCTVSGLGSSWNYTVEQMPGDEDTITIKYKGTAIKSWTISYQ